ncbi:unnamed protein product [Prorocentrum cordatum]|uniref:Type II protein arginine methyltransferase n=1 Tax=Prorocentrum cordatum TaxID=2364126 RepID=A0ABN9WWR6_9DINO|nr:unnamed protein product [Polarella glacialis]
MGFKKGRAARSANLLAAPGDAPQDRFAAETSPVIVRHDGGTCVIYVDPTGSEYNVDVALMEQLNTRTGTRRRVFRLQGHGRVWPVWQFEAATEGCRRYTPPKCVVFALEERFRILHEDCADHSGMHPHKAAVAELDEAALWKLVECLEEACCEKGADDIRKQWTSDMPTEDLTSMLAYSSASIMPSDRSPDESLEQVMTLVRAVLVDKVLQHALAERVLQAPWPHQRLLRAARCLLRCGWRPLPSNCRLVALGSGSLSLLRLLLDAGVDVCGLVLFEPGKKRAKQSQSEGSWVQCSKNALRALMARGAVLGEGAPRSKLLKKLEEDGDALWVERALDGLQRACPELPDVVLRRLREFC